ncbi:potassium transporter 5-like protein, partial [Trifolium pratense]
RFGTDKVGYAFAPIILVWFLLIGVIGLYNLLKYDIGVLRAFNPMYIVDYMKRNGKDGWLSLGGIFLCITGVDAEKTSQQQTNSYNFVKDGKGSSDRIVPASTSYNQEVDVSRASSDSIHSSEMISSISNQNLQGVEEEISFVQREMEKSVVYMLREAEVVAEPNSSILKKIVVHADLLRHGSNLSAYQNIPTNK